MDIKNKSPVITNSLFDIKDQVKLLSFGVSKAGITYINYLYKVGKQALLSNFND